MAFAKITRKFLAAAALLPALPGFAAEKPYGQVSLYVMPAYPVAMNWSSPSWLLSSAMKGSFSNGEMTIGHVSVEVTCGMKAGSTVPDRPSSGSHVLTSMVDAVDDPSSDMLLNQKLGFAVLERAWPGRVESPEEVHGSFDLTNGDPKRFSAVTFLVPETSCRRLTKFFREFSAAPSLYYGNSPRPRRKEGAGCTSFAVAFLELAGIMTKEMHRSWAVTVRVPLSLMGGMPEHKEIALMDILYGKDGAAWAPEGAPAMTLETYEPQLMHKWIADLVANPVALQALGGELDTQLPHGLHGIPAIRLDRRSVATPKGPIFLGAPALKAEADGKMVRADKTVAADGSFELKP